MTMLRYGTTKVMFVRSWRRPWSGWARMPVLLLLSGAIAVAIAVSIAPGLVTAWSVPSCSRSDRLPPLVLSLSFRPQMTTPAFPFDDGEGFVRYAPTTAGGRSDLRREAKSNRSRRTSSTSTVSTTSLNSSRRSPNRNSTSGRDTDENTDRTTPLTHTTTPTTHTWEDLFQVLVRYKEHAGHCNVPARYYFYTDSEQEEAVDDSGAAEMTNRRNNTTTTKKNHTIPLGRWVVKQRQHKVQGTLAAYKVQKLTALGMVWDPLTEKWETMAALLEQYTRREGHCHVPQRHRERQDEDDEVVDSNDAADDLGSTKRTRRGTTRPEYNLGRWLANQRQAYRQQKLAAYKIARLEHISFASCCVSASSVASREANPDATHDTATAVVDDEVMNSKYQQIWDPTNAKWHEMYHLLQAYTEREGHGNVPSRHQEHGKALGTWWYNQHRTTATAKAANSSNYQRNPPRNPHVDTTTTDDQDRNHDQLQQQQWLCNYREERFEELGLVWDTVSEHWEDMYA